MYIYLKTGLGKEGSQVGVECPFNEPAQEENVVVSIGPICEEVFHQVMV